MLRAWMMVSVLGLAGLIGCGSVSQEASSSGTGGQGGEGSGGDQTTTSSAGGGGSGASDGGACAPVIGTLQGGCAAFDSDHATACCKSQGGIEWDYCQWPGCSASTCYATPPAPAAGEFACHDIMNCKVGKQVCVFNQQYTDGCPKTSCTTPPAPCDATPTCACLQANHLLDTLGGHCEEDAAGNASATGADLSWAPKGPLSL